MARTPEARTKRSTGDGGGSAIATNAASSAHAAASSARATRPTWYRRLEQARSQGRLQEFLDEDAGLPRDQIETLHDFMVDWFRLDAAPELATATAISYLHVYNKHLRPLAGHRPLEQFELPGRSPEVLGQMAAAGARTGDARPRSQGPLVGVRLGRRDGEDARERRAQRPAQPSRSRRLSAAEDARRGHHEVAARRKAWAISPEAFAALHRGALDRRTPDAPAGCPTATRSPSSMLYGLGPRPQELFLSGDVSAGQPEPVPCRAGSHQGPGPPGSAKPVGRIISAAKTTEGVRTMAMRPWLYEELRDWRADCSALVYRPATTTSSSRAPRTTATTPSSSSTTSSATSRRAAASAAERNAELAYLTKVTPYSLRRGHIPARARARRHQADRRRLRDIDSNDPPPLSARARHAPRAAGGLQLRRRGSKRRDARCATCAQPEVARRTSGPARRSAPGWPAASRPVRVYTESGMDTRFASLPVAARSTTAVWESRALLTLARGRCGFAGLSPS